MDFTIQNIAPDSDVVHMVFGDNSDSCVTVTVDRDEQGIVTIRVVDNMDNSTRKIILGKPGFSEHSDFEVEE